MQRLDDHTLSSIHHILKKWDALIEGGGDGAEKASARVLARYIEEVAKFERPGLGAMLLANFETYGACVESCLAWLTGSYADETRTIRASTVFRRPLEQFYNMSRFEMTDGLIAAHTTSDWENYKKHVAELHVIQRVPQRVRRRRHRVQMRRIVEASRREGAKPLVLFAASNGRVKPMSVRDAREAVASMPSCIQVHPEVAATLRSPHRDVVLYLIGIHPDSCAERHRKWKPLLSHFED